jgi:signal peptidase II
MADPDARPGSPPSPARWGLFAGLAAVVLVLDQITKVWVDSSFAEAWTHRPIPGRADPTPLVGDLVRIAKTYNDGGIFGLFDASATILAPLSAVVIVLIAAYWFRVVGRGPLLGTVALGLLLGGAVGNLIDRIRLGKVIDWVDMGIGDARWYTWNIADAGISISIVLLLVLAVLGDRLAAREPTRPAGDRRDAAVEEVPRGADLPSTPAR